MELSRTYRCVWCGALFRAINNPSNLLKVTGASMDVSAGAILPVNDSRKGGRLGAMRRGGRLEC